MATSPSSSGWYATAAVFSGRRDPTWDVPAGEAAALVAAYDTLPPGGDPPAAPPLGYRGVRLRAPDGRSWAAYGGVVAGPERNAADGGRAWERRLLATAPPGTVPPGAVPPAPGG